MKLMRTQKAYRSFLFALLISACTAASQTERPSGTTETPQPPTATPTQEATPTPTPLPTGSLQPRLIDELGVEMVLIPEGIFTMGSDEGDAHESPRHEVYTDAVYMDVFETTNTLYQFCVEVGG